MAGRSLRRAHLVIYFFFVPPPPSPQTQALRNLGLTITRAEITEGDDRNRFYVTDIKVRVPRPLAPRLVHRDP